MVCWVSSPLVSFQTHISVLPQCGIQIMGVRLNYYDNEQVTDKIRLQELR